MSWTLADLVGLGAGGLTLAGAAVVMLSRNIFRSALGLLAALLGVAGLFALLHADFLAVAQLLVYVGGVLVLILFAVMLTASISDASRTNTHVNLMAGAALFISTAAVLIIAAVTTPWQLLSPPKSLQLEASANPLLLVPPISQQLGEALLNHWLLPFELASVVLLLVLAGSVTIARQNRPEHKLGQLK